VVDDRGASRPVGIHLGPRCQVVASNGGHQLPWSDGSQGRGPPRQVGIESRRKLPSARANAANTARRAEIIKVAADVFRERGYDAHLNDWPSARDDGHRSTTTWAARRALQEIVRDVLSRTSRPPSR